LPSVAWRTGQSGAPPDTVQCGSLSLFGETKCCRFLAVGAPDTVRCTPDSPVHPSDRWLCHTSRADSAADRWFTGQSGAPPDSPVIYSRTSLIASREQPVDSRRSGAPDTVRCTTEHCPVHHRTVRCTQTAQSLGCQPSLFQFGLFLFLALRHNTLVFKTMY
jgi:hypothetical protein